MNREVLHGKWKQLKGDVKVKFGKLTDDDLAQTEGNEEKIIGKLQERYGYSKEEAHEEWNKFSRKYDEGTHEDIRDAEKKAGKARDPK
jgi:uncharacterized protein YjbJ (UPF0337 family)